MIYLPFDTIIFTKSFSRLAATYNFDVLESLVEESPKCNKCGKDAAKRCSRCRNQWYCSR